MFSCMGLRKCKQAKEFGKSMISLSFHLLTLNLCVRFIHGISYVTELVQNCYSDGRSFTC